MPQRKGLKGAPKANKAAMSDALPYEHMFGPADDDEAVRNLMVNYIPNKVSEEDLKVIFGVYGPVEHFRVIKDKKTDEPKGYGFVKYMYGFSAFAAMMYLNGYHVYHKRLKVSFAENTRAYELMSDRSLMAKWESQQPAFLKYYNDYQFSYSRSLQDFLRPQDGFYGDVMPVVG
eukprot:TRINITY_DN3819_c0_g1_i1.p1 TRINITY_DN3819_c0_g1~~TRINITY_DN3819_c0_g1_i1.p1  ORF type:complete len:174 (+),score=17.78 TRINITY_DN3819_c0_g1_i1:54-575(+)